MVMKAIYLNFALLIIVRFGYCQYNSLSVGDAVPDVEFRNLVNYPDRLSLGKLSNKLVILDFWTTGCPSCIEAIPKMEMLQEEFKEYLQIILVNPWESKEKIEKRLSQMNHLRPDIGLTSLPVVYGDSIWRNIFPHTSVPHHVWIDNGQVIAVTGAQNATRENIQKVINGIDISFSIKDDLKASGYDIKSNGIFNKAHPSISPAFYSVIAKSHPGFGSGNKHIADTIDNLFVRRMLNLSIIELYKIAFNIPYFESKRIKITVQDKTSFFPPDDANNFDNWFESQCFSYEIGLPTKDKEYFNIFMQNDLNRFFRINNQIEGLIEVKEYPCWILQKTKGEISQAILNPQIIETDSSIIYQAQPISLIYNALRSALENVDDPIFVVDETETNANVTIELPLNLNDVKRINQQLLNANLKLKRGKRKIGLLVIREITSD